jgi:hypothetical protein
MKNLLLTVTLCSFFIGNLFGQNEKGRNWTMEIGGTKSYMNSTVTIINTNEVYTARLNYSNLLPTFRINRNIHFQKNTFSIQPFIGVSIIGMSRGKMNANVFQIDTSIYFFSINRATVRMHYLELGSFLNYRIKNFDIQLGLKGQYLLLYRANITLDYSPQRVRLIPTPSPDNSELEPSTKNLAHFSANAGLRIQYHWKRFTIATEYWQGITDLSLAETNWFENDAYENNIRLMFGYKL